MLALGQGLAALILEAVAREVKVDKLAKLRTEDELLKGLWPDARGAQVKPARELKQRRRLALEQRLTPVRRRDPRQVISPPQRLLKVGLDDLGEVFILRPLGQVRDQELPRGLIGALVEDRAQLAKELLAFVGYRIISLRAKSKV